MQTWQWTPGATAHLKKIVLAALLAASLAGCGLFKPDPDAEAAREVERLLAFEPFGAAAFEIDENEIVVTAAVEAEAGIFLRASEQAAEPVIVRFAYRDATPLNLRLKRGDAYDYFSAAAETFILLGTGHASEALFYGAGPLDFRIEVEDISACGKDNFVCFADGRIEQTFGGAGLKGRVLIDTYGGARLEDIGKSSAQIVRNASQGEYGLTLTLAQDDEDRNYVLEFEVDKPEQVQLRVERGGQLRYHSATRGWARINADTEILLFSGGVSNFEVRNLKLNDCDKNEWRCKTAEDFAELLPGDAGDTSTGRLLALTEWVTANADFALSPSVANRLEITGLTPSQMYFRYYEPNAGAGYCGATAVFLARTLRLQGFQAFSFDFGLKDDNLTHVTTIVPMGPEFYLVDATFGGYYVHPGSDQLIDIFEIMDGAPFEFKTLNMGQRDFVLDKSDEARLSRMKYADALKNCYNSKDHPVIICERPGFGLDAYLSNFEAELKKNGLTSSPETLIELMRRGVFGIGDYEETDAMRRFARELDARGIPLAASPRRLLE